MRFIGKKGESVLYENITYMVVNLLFFSMLFVFVAKAGSGSSAYEEVYARKIAMIVDMAKPGDTINLDISDMSKIAEKNKFSISNIVRFDNDKKEVLVRLGGGKGYSFGFFTDTNVISEVNTANKMLKLVMGK